MSKQFDLKLAGIALILFFMGMVVVSNVFGAERPIDLTLEQIHEQYPGMPRYTDAKRAELKELCSGEYNKKVRKKCYPHWLDLDLDGFDSRQQALLESSLIPPTIEKKKGKFKVTAGLWRGFYTGELVTDPGALDYEHGLAVCEIHKTGGKNLTQEQRALAANDVTHLVLTLKGPNRQRGCKQIASWMSNRIPAWAPTLEMRSLMRERYGSSYQQCEQETEKLASFIADRTSKGIKIEKYVDLVINVFERGSSPALRKLAQGFVDCGGIDANPFDRLKIVEE